MIEFFNAHLPILPVAIPLIGAALTLIINEQNIRAQRFIAWIAVLLMLAAGMFAIDRTAGGHLSVYLLGNWQAPFGIALAVDKLSAIMVLLTAFVAAVVLYAAQQSDTDRGIYFTPLFMLQLMGLNGAFLTADLFNLFVFFEVLLAASYGMLLQHADRAKTNAATHYVVINLVGSALFLIAASLLYGVTGTLNMADLSVKINALPPDSRALVLSAGFILLTVFAIKAALLPLNFWLTGTYARAVLPIAALFALMTKVGVVAIIRTLTLIYPDGTFGNIAMNKVLIIIAPITLLVAACGALASREVKTLIGWSVVGSAGMLVTAVAIGNAKALSGALFYLIGSTLAVALLFLNAAAIDASTSRVSEGAANSNRHWAWIGALFFIGAVVVTGLPPFSGFIGKAVILAGAVQHLWPTWILSAVLIAGLLNVIAYARIGSRLFWKRDAVVGATTYVLPTSILAAAIAAMTIFASPIQRYTDQAAIELRHPAIMRDNVLGKRPLERKNEPSKATQ
jgi:multicomponent K+:H+ antiporter subunit D